MAKGGTPADTDKARELFTRLDAKQNLQNFINGLNYVKARKDCSGSLGCVGFCWGGGMSDRMPPSEVILVRGYRQWSGSYGRQDLLNEIGKAIETRNREGDPSQATKKDKKA